MLNVSFFVKENYPSQQHSLPLTKDLCIYAGKTYRFTFRNFLQRASHKGGQQVRPNRASCPLYISIMLRPKPEVRQFSNWPKFLGKVRCTLNEQCIAYNSFWSGNSRSGRNSLAKIPSADPKLSDRWYWRAGDSREPVTANLSYKIYKVLKISAKN